MRSAMICLLPAAALLLSVQAAWGQTAVGKISRNFYRNPYANNTDMTVTRDYVDHGVSQGGSSNDAGKMDMVASGRNAAIVAAAAGQVIQVFDGNNDCGCNGAFGGCANVIAIRHANGEVSRYLHIAQNSALVVLNQNVVMGQAIATEGDVGFTCGGSGGASPRAGGCIPSVPSGTGNCGRHLHWEVFRDHPAPRPNEFVNPMICGGVSGNIFQDDTSYTASACDSNNCPENRNLANQTLSGFGTFRVWQASNSITASTVTTASLASVVMHAGNRVRLTPGFRAAANSYFRAEIGSCNATAPNP